MKKSVVLFLLFIAGTQCFAQVDTIFKVFQFPADKIPCIDGNASDWDIVPASYCYGNERLKSTKSNPKPIDSTSINVKVKVAWVKGMNRLYFLYEAEDNYWDFSRTDLHHDIFEVVVDGDQSGGVFIEKFHPNKSLSKMDAFYSIHGIHAQNYHIYTPAEGQDWCLAWGCQPWIKELPWANAAYRYNFRPGEAGKLSLEFWITPFDFAPSDASKAVESKLYENKNIGLCWAVLDYDNVDSDKQDGFWNLSDKHTMYGRASEMRTFRLMPLEKQFQKKIEANWEFKILDMSRRLVAFTDLSVGKLSSWKWDFGDGKTSTEQHPLHVYEQAGLYIVTLWVEGPDGKSRRAKVWDVAIR